jgi:RNA ligase (TIGR02306 family)
MLEEKRALASVATIEDVRPIPDADAIVVGTVRGWDVVVKKGDYNNGDKVIYIEPDAALPLDNPAFEFLRARAVKKIDGEEYHVLKTARLRGQVSQGIVFPVDQFADVLAQLEQEKAAGEVPAGRLDELLKIQLYEPPQPINQAGQIGPWPINWLRKTDAERVQNLSDEFLATSNDGGWIPTEKVDGSSLTFWLDGEKLRMCSRNFELDPDTPSTPVEVAENYKLAELMRANGFEAIQGELYGDQVNANRLRVSGHRLAVFAAWSRDERGKAVTRFHDLADSGLPLAPVLEGLEYPTTVRQAIEQADKMKSVINPQVLAEGIVWHHPTEVAYRELDYRLVWKSVSPSYLIKHKL